MCMRSICVWRHIPLRDGRVFFKFQRILRIACRVVFWKDMLEFVLPVRHRRFLGKVAFGCLRYDATNGNMSAIPIEGEKHVMFFFALSGYFGRNAVYAKPQLCFLGDVSSTFHRAWWTIYLSEITNHYFLWKCMKVHSVSVRIDEELVRTDHQGSSLVLWQHIPTHNMCFSVPNNHSLTDFVFLTPLEGTRFLKVPCHAASDS